MLSMNFVDMFSVGHLALVQQHPKASLTSLHSNSTGINNLPLANRRGHEMQSVRLAALLNNQLLSASLPRSMPLGSADVRIPHRIATMGSGPGRARKLTRDGCSVLVNDALEGLREVAQAAAVLRVGLPAALQQVRPLRLAPRGNLWRPRTHQPCKPAASQCLSSSCH